MKIEDILKNRFFIFGLGVIGVLLIALLVLGVVDDINEIGGMVDAPTPTPTVVASITETPRTPTPAPTTVAGEIQGAQSVTEVLDNLMYYVLNPNTPYGYQITEDVRITENDMLKIAGISGYGKQISYLSVNVGDIGIYGRNICICIGFDENGHALFAYANDYESSMLKSGGIYVGYSLYEYDQLYYGMYPVPCEAYYRGVSDSVVNTALMKKIEACKKYLNSDENKIYAAGRMFSGKLTKEIAGLIPEGLLVEHNLKLNEEKLEGFVASFVEAAQAPEIKGEFAFVSNKSYESKTTRYVVTKLLSLAPADFLDTYGKWEITITENGIVPFDTTCPERYMFMGFEKAKEVQYVYDEFGTVIGSEIKEYEDVTGTITQTETGESYYHGEGYVSKIEDGVTLLLYEEGKNIVNLGNYEYALWSNDGEVSVVDISPHAHLPEELLLLLLEEMLNGINNAAE